MGINDQIWNGQNDPSVIAIQYPNEIYRQSNMIKMRHNLIEEFLDLHHQFRLEFFRF